MSLRAIVLAAGQGTRMKSDLPKVLFPIAGRPLVSWVLDAVAAQNPDETVVVVGHGADEVREILPAGVTAVVQGERLGTGHAVMVALAAMGKVDGDTLLVVPGDSPLLKPVSLTALLARHGLGALATLLTARMPDPTGYGRIVRKDGEVAGIVEERDADPEQRLIDEVAVSTYAFDGRSLADALTQIGRVNDQGEYYLPDVIGLLSARGPVLSVSTDDPTEVTGVNSHEQLAAAAEVMRRRINASWMRSGVWMLDPSRVYLDAAVTIEPGARLYPDVHLEGSTTVAAGATIGPGVFAADSVVGARGRGGRRSPGWAVRQSASGHSNGDRVQGGVVRRDQEHGDRPRQQGASPVVHGRRHHRRGSQHRRRKHHLQLRRLGQALDRHRG
jgi:bifunctional UDP-N-acetylglucosamine pyrophosphorylase/glucosamine-1-phosphate N-acetyltransferase